MHLLLTAEDSISELRSEIMLSFPGIRPTSADSALVEVDFQIAPGQRLPYLAYARQFLPDVRPTQAESIRAWANVLFEAVAGFLPEDGAWRLHVEARYPSRPLQRIGARAWHTASRYGPARTKVAEPAHLANAGRNRCALIQEAFQEVLQKRRRHLLRQLRHELKPFQEEDSLVQVLLTSPGTGFISLAPAPLAFEQRHLVSFFPRGEVEQAVDKAAPSRAFAKLIEAEARLGHSIRPGEVCVDLGAAPGSWTYVAVKRRARVIAVDRSPLADDLMRNSLVTFRPGDAFRFEPEDAVDWLLCDVIAAPERSADLVVTWVKRRWCRHFVVTIKMKDDKGMAALQKLKTDLPPLCKELFLTRLCANKREVCAFGAVYDVKIEVRRPLFDIAPARSGRP